MSCKGWRLSARLRPLVRAFDVGLVVLASPIVVPLCAAISVIIRSRDGAPILYRAPRMGIAGEQFTMYKFRSMRETGDASPLTRAGDTRVTPLGRWLRRWKLDELPQLLHVVRGEMGLVGPRPEDPRYREFMEGSLVIQGACLPGITSPASVTFRDEEKRHVGDPSAVEERYLRLILPCKLEAERTYLLAAGPLTDIRLLIRSILPRRNRDTG